MPLATRLCSKIPMPPRSPSFHRYPNNFPTLIPTAPFPSRIPLPKVPSLPPLWRYLSTPSGSSASCSVSLARLWLHFCNNGRAGTSRQFNEITHRMCTPTSESTFSKAHTSSASSGLLSSYHPFFSYLSSCSSLDSSVLLSRPITLSHISPSPLSHSASLRILSSP